MRLLFAIKGLHRATGGAERVICDVCSFLAEQRGHEVSLLTFDPPGTVPFYSLSPSVRVLQLGLGNPAAPTSPVQLIQRMVALRRVVKVQNPDVVVAFMHSMFIPMAFALAGLKVPLVASEHTTATHYRTRRVEFGLFIAAVPFIDRITVLSDLVAKHYPLWIYRKMVPVTNPVSPIFFSAMPHPGDGNSKRILSVGSFSTSKDHITLVRAFELLAREFPEWSLRILGDGPLRPALEREVSMLELDGRVSLPGVTTDVAREMADASLFALASQYESFGLVFAEAMACGKASVAFADCQGASEIIDHDKTGLLVAGADRVTAMADGMRRMMADEVKRNRMGADARDSVSRRFSIELVCARWEQVLGETINVRNNRVLGA
jgi:glycosyltransferase involved in cell wall biosynthesis